MTDFSLALFSTNPALVRKAEEAGIEMIVVDWESRGKADRQLGADTQINYDTPDDLRKVRESTRVAVLCRVNPSSESTRDEVDLAIGLGADEIMLPMVRSPREVESLLGLIDGRCGGGILIETEDAVACASDLSSFPLSRVYFGLHDFAIERRSPNIFEPLVDGTLESVRETFSVPFGFGGLTLPDRGSPIPCRLLLGEMVRLRCSFSFLRRSFHRDVEGAPLDAAVSRIRNAVQQAVQRSDESVAADRRELATAVERWPSRGDEAQEATRSAGR